MKIMENEENRGPINKKASEDQWVRFFLNLLSVYFWSSLIILYLSLTLGHLEFLENFLYWTNKAKKAGKRKKQARRSKNQATTT